jgi:hypothetical protein
MENLVHSSSVVDDVAISNYSREETRGIHLAEHILKKPNLDWIINNK